MDNLTTLIVASVPAPAVAAPSARSSAQVDGTQSQQDSGNSDFGKAVDAAAAASQQQQPDAPAKDAPAAPAPDAPVATKLAPAASAQPQDTGAMAALVNQLLAFALDPAGAAADTDNTTPPVSEMGGLQANTNPPYPPLAAVHPFLLAAEVAAAPLADADASAGAPAPVATPLAQDLQAVLSALKVPGDSAPVVAAPLPQTAALPHADIALAAPEAATPAAPLPAVPVAVPAPTANTNDATVLTAPVITNAVATAKPETPAPSSKNAQDAVTALDNAANATRQADASSYATQLPVLPVSSPGIVSLLLSPLPSDDSTNKDSTDDTSGVSASGQSSQPLNFAASQIQHDQNDTFSRMLASTHHNTAVDQVTVQFKNMAAAGTGSIRIQLAPADLGRVEVQMTMGADGKTNVTVTADNRNTLDMLQQGARQLEQSLRDVGIKTETGQLSFNLRGEQQQQQQKFTTDAYAQTASLDDDDQDFNANNSISHIYQVQLHGGVDIRV